MSFRRTYPRENRYPRENSTFGYIPMSNNDVSEPSTSAFYDVTNTSYSAPSTSTSNSTFGSINMSNQPNVVPRMNQPRVFNPFFTPIGSPIDSEISNPSESESNISSISQTSENQLPPFEELNILLPSNQIQTVATNFAIANQMNSVLGNQSNYYAIRNTDYDSNNQKSETSETSLGGFISYRKFLGK